MAGSAGDERVRAVLGRGGSLASVGAGLVGGIRMPWGLPGAFGVSRACP